MPDYNLGTAHGQIVVDYDDKGSKKAKGDFADVGKESESLRGRLDRLGSTLSDLRSNFGDMATHASRNFALFAGGAAIFANVARSGSLFGGMLRSLSPGLRTISSVRTLLGGVPKSMSGFPNAIKQIVMLSAAIKVFGASSGILGKALQSFGKMAAANPVIKSLTDRFPILNKVMSEFGARSRTVVSGATKDFNSLTTPIRVITTLAYGFVNLRSAISKISSIVKVFSIVGVSALAMGAILQSLIGILGGVYQAASQLSGLFGLYPGILAAIGIGMATVKIGMSGVDDAMKNVFASSEKFRKSIKDLAPNAQAAMKQIRSMKDQFAGLRNSVQDRLFAGMSSQIRVLGGTYMPILRRGMSSVADGANNMVHQFGAFLKQGQTVKDVNSAFSFTHQIMDNLAKAVKPLLNAFRDIGIVSLQAFRDLSKGAGSASERFAKFIHQARSDGSMLAWIRGGIAGFKDLIAIVKNIGGILGSVFGAFNKSNTNFLASIRASTENLNAFLKSAEGQEKLRKFAETIDRLSTGAKQLFGSIFKTAGPLISQLIPLIVQLAEATGGSLGNALNILLPVFRLLVQALVAAGPVLVPIITTLLTVGLATKGLGLAAKIALGPIGLLKNGISVLGAAYTFARNPLLGITKATDVLSGKFPKLTSSLKTAATGVGVHAISMKQKLTDAYNAMSSGASKVGNKMASGLKTAGSKLLEMGKSAGTAAGNMVKSFGSMIASGAKAAASMIKTAAIIVARWAVMAAQAVAKAAIMAAAWIAANPWALIVAAIVAIVAFIITHWQQVKEVVIAVWNAIKAAAMVVWNAIKGVIMPIVNLIKAQIIANFNIVKAIVIGVFNAIKIVAQTVWNAIKIIIETVINIIKGIIEVVLGLITGDWSRAWNGIKQVVSAVWNGIKSLVDTGINFVKSIISNTLNTIKNVVTGAWDGIKGAFSTGIGKIKDAVKTGITAVLQFFKDLPGKIVGALGDLGSLLFEAGKKVLQGFLDGLKAIWDKVTGFISSIGGWIADHKGPISYDKRLLIPAGVAIMQGLLNGLESKHQEVARKMQQISATIAGTAFSTSAITSGNFTVGGVRTAEPTLSPVSALAALAGGGGSTPYIGNLTVQTPNDGPSAKEIIDEALFAVRHMSRGGAHVGA